MPPANACALRIDTRAEPDGDDGFVLIATATNTTSANVATVVEAPCPGSAVTFSGLPEGYDVGGRCVQGACASGPRSREALSIAQAATS